MNTNLNIIVFVDKGDSSDLSDMLKNEHDYNLDNLERQKDSRSPVKGIITSAGGSSTASSRDTSPCRELSPLVTNLKPPIIIRRGPHGLGFTVHTIRVYYGDSDFYTMHHLVMAVDENSSAFEAGLRPADLITHVNGEAVQGLFHTQVIQLLLNNNQHDHVTLRATPLEHTSIQSGGRRRDIFQSKLAKKSVSRHKKQRKDAEKKRRSSLFRRISTKRASAEIQQMAVVLSSPVGIIPTPLSRLNLLDTQPSISSQITSPSSSAPNTPTSHPGCNLGLVSNNNKNIPPQIYHHHHHHHHQRPSTLHGLKHKLHSAVPSSKSSHHVPANIPGGGTGLTSSPSSTRRKSVGHIPLSPLARTPSPSPLSSSPTRSPSPLAFPIPGHLPGASNTTQSYSPGTLPNGNSLSNTTTSIGGGMIGTNGSSTNTVKKSSFTRPKSAEPGSPLLRRALSPDRLHPRTAENKCTISPLCCSSQIPSISVTSSNPTSYNNSISMGLKKQRNTSTSSNPIWRNISTGSVVNHEVDPSVQGIETNVSATSTTENFEQKTNTTQISTGMLTLSLQSQSELLPIAEEKDSPTNGAKCDKI